MDACGWFLAALVALTIAATLFALVYIGVSELMDPHARDTGPVMIRVACKGRRTIYSTMASVPVRGDCQVSLLWPPQKDAK